MPKYVNDKKTLKEFIEYETNKCSRGGGVKSFLKILLLSSEAEILRKHIILLRKAEYHKNTGHKLRGFYYLSRLKKLQNKYSMHIPLNVFDKGLRIMHLGPVLVNDKVVAGKNCCLHMNTAIVSSGKKEPVLGDNVWLGYGACVLGGVTVPNYVAIGAGAVVNKSIEEENIVVAGVPAKKISDKGTLTWHN